MGSRARIGLSPIPTISAERDGLDRDLRGRARGPSGHPPPPARHQQLTTALVGWCVPSGRVRAESASPPQSFCFARSIGFSICERSMPSGSAASGRV
jgi:hypothetical protein